MTQVSQEECTTEIVRLHDFFQEWFRAETDESDEQFTRFAAAMAADFAIVGPNGQLTELPSLTAGLRSAYGKQPAIRIWTKNHHLRWQHGDVTLCTYEEWQETVAGTTVRLSSVLFKRELETPNGLRWLHVHETWIATP